MDKALSDLKTELKQVVDAYIENTLQIWVIEVSYQPQTYVHTVIESKAIFFIDKVLSGEFRSRVKRRCESLLGTYASAVRQEHARVRITQYIL